MRWPVMSSDRAKIFGKHVGPLKNGFSVYPKDAGYPRAVLP